MKICRTCNTEKSEIDFGKRKASPDGLSPRCKSCQSNYDKARNKSPHRIELRDRYAQTEGGRIRTAKAKSEWRKRNPKKSKAHNHINRMIRNGKLKKQPCEICGESKVHAHHDDYSKPLEIRWLCSKHHSQWHAENGEALNP